MDRPPFTAVHLPLNLLTYDSARRRLWVAGQRCHHGATGVLLTGSAAVGLAAARCGRARALVLVTTGSMLMAHDWKDRAVWFERGWQSQP